MKLHKVNVDETTDLSPVILPQEYLDKLKLMVFDITQFFNNNGIEYWADGGTLLGAVRDKNQIPWDDDADFGMDVKSFFKLKRLFPQLIEKGYEVIDQKDDVIKIVDNNNMYIRTIGLEDMTQDTHPRACCIDIFLYVEKKNEFKLSTIGNQRLFPNCIYKKKDLYPLKEYDYDTFKIKAANNPYNYLKSYYGDWEKKVIHIYT